MLTRSLSTTRHDDEGVALLVAITLTALATILMITMTTLVLREGRQTSRERDRSVSIMTAEGGIDNALAQIQNAAVGSIPCGTTTQTSTSSKPEIVTVTTTVTYYDASGVALPCQGSGGLLSTNVAVQAGVKSVSVSQPKGGGLQVRRAMETLVQLKPKFANDLSQAIFGNAGVTFSNNFDLYGQSGPDADVYTNGDFVCSHNEHFRGSVYAQGSITLNNSCTIDVNASSKTGFSSTSTQASVGGDVMVSNGNADISAGTIGGKVKAVTITPASFCNTYPNKCVTGANAAPPPPAVGFPQLGDTTQWLAPTSSGGGGYTMATTSSGSQWFDNCSDTSASDNPGNWIATNGASLSNPTLLQTHCTLRFKSNVKNVNLSQNLAVFASGGIDLEQSLDFASTTSTKHYLYLMQPYGSTCVDSGKGFNLGIYMGNLVTMEPTISELLYTPCDVHKENQSSTYGQVFAGGTANIDNKTDATYVPMPVFGAVVTKVVLSYTSDILYKRETSG
jgi:hypothetical protein